MTLSARALGAAILRLFLRAEALITGLALLLAAGFLVIAGTMTIWQVGNRFLLGQPSTWSEVVARSAMVWSVFTGVAVAFRHGAMLTVEVIRDALPARLGLGLMVLTTLMSMGFFAIVFWQGWGMVLRVQRQNLAALDISIAWVYAALPVGSVFAIVALAGCLVRALAGLPPTVDDAGDAARTGGTGGRA